MRIWEALENNGKGVVSDWDLPKEQAAKLDNKLNMLRNAEVDARGRVNLPPGLLDGPGVWKQQHIYKFRARGKQALRPMLCLGPVDLKAEWTVLARAREQDNDTTEQKTAAKTATVRRAEILAGIRGRRPYGE